MLVRSTRRQILVFGFSLILSGSALAAETFTVVGIGDSITKAFNAEHYFRDSPDVSWATGNKGTSGLISHLMHLKKIYPQKTFASYNFAATGAVVKDLAGQVKKAIAKKPDYATFLVGANDICNWNEDYQDDYDAFISGIKQNLNSLITANPKIKITMSAMPDVYHVWKISKDKSSCRTVWSIIRICRQLLAKNVTDEQRLAFRERWQHANSGLASAAAMFPQNVKFSDAAANYEFASDDVSKHDCFHPSIKGQSVLAKATWEEGWYGSSAGFNLADSDTQSDSN